MLENNHNSLQFAGRLGPGILHRRTHHQPVRPFGRLLLGLRLQRLQILGPPRLQRGQLLVAELMLLRVNVVLHTFGGHRRQLAQLGLGRGGAGGGVAARVRLVVVVVNRNGHREVWHWIAICGVGSQRVELRCAVEVAGARKVCCHVWMRCGCG